MSRSAGPIRGSTRTGSREPTATVADRDRRRDILDAAIDEFSALGFSGARIDTIAAKSGANKQLIYYYFDSKVGLYDAVVEEMVQRSNVRMDTHGTHLTVSDAVHAHVDSLVAEGGDEWLRFWLWEALQGTPVDAIVKTDRARVWSRWVTEFRRAQARGEIDSRFDAKMLALAFNSIIVTPYMTPLVTKLITGRDPHGDAFKKRQLTLVTEFLQLLKP